MLVFLAHDLTVCARGTFEAGTERVLEPEALRRFNEIQHRVTGAIRDRLIKAGGMPLEDVIAMVQSFATERPAGGLKWALEHAAALTEKTCWPFAIMEIITHLKEKFQDLTA